MADKKEIKRRIKSIRNIGQITKALQMVSAVKMRKAQQALLSSTPYFEQMEEIFNTMLLDIGKNEIAELFATKGNKKKSNIALIMISPSKGFAGPLISNLTKKTVEFIEKRNSDTPYTNGEFLIFHEKEHNITHNQAAEEEKVDIKLVTIEKKSRDFAVKIHKEVIADFPQLSNPPIFHDILPLSNIVIDGYKDGSIQEVFVVYTHFINTFIQKAVIKKLLPFDLDRVYETLKGHDTAEHWYTYSQDQITIFTEFYPVYIETLLFHSVLDAVAAEHSARMIAMKNATDNARDLRRELTLEYNQKRQAGITQEIAEITSAAETL